METGMLPYTSRTIIRKIKHFSIIPITFVSISCAGPEAGSSSTKNEMGSLVSIKTLPMMRLFEFDGKVLAPNITSKAVKVWPNGTKAVLALNEKARNEKIQFHPNGSYFTTAERIFCKNEECSLEFGGHLNPKRGAGKTTIFKLFSYTDTGVLKAGIKGKVSGRGNWPGATIKIIGHPEGGGEKELLSETIPVNYEGDVFNLEGNYGFTGLLELRVEMDYAVGDKNYSHRFKLYDAFIFSAKCLPDQINEGQCLKGSPEDMVVISN
ncbi:MAG: hypothetical protein CMP10_17685 [Zetaproteobacteria bacterium]|nr:hypothetical protein [Pseudobdellovibrionaceae bacterium]